MWSSGTCDCVGHTAEAQHTCIKEYRGGPRTARYEWRIQKGTGVARVPLITFHVPPHTHFSAGVHSARRHHLQWPRHTPTWVRRQESSPPAFHYLQVFVNHLRLRLEYLGGLMHGDHPRVVENVLRAGGAEGGKDFRQRGLLLLASRTLFTSSTVQDQMSTSHTTSRGHDHPHHPTPRVCPA